MAFILASGSPRRRELLSLLGIKDFIVRPSDVDETLPCDFSPAEDVKLLSLKKAEAAAKNADKDDVILSADTLVFLDGRALSKPSDNDDAFRMLRALSGRAHQVHTGFTLYVNGEFHSYSECTEVFFSELSDEEIRDYIATGECADKAGAYGVQGYAARFVTRIEGDYYNVMGLPVSGLYRALRSLGLERLL